MFIEFKLIGAASGTVALPSARRLAPSELLVPGLLHVAGLQRFIDGMNRRTYYANSNGPSAVLYSAGEGITGQRYTLRLAGARGKMEKIIEF